MRSRTLSLVIFGLCVLAFPVTAMVLDWTTPPGQKVFSMTPAEAQRALVVTQDVHSDAAAVWAAAANLCTTTPGCQWVQIEGTDGRTKIKSVRLRVVQSAAQDLVDTRFQNQTFSVKAMEEISRRVYGN